MNIRVIGTGGIGLCLLPTLCRYVNYKEGLFPEPTIHLVDGDEFEERNRERQGFRLHGNKAQVTAEELQDQFGRINFVSHESYVDVENVVRHVRENDIVLLCVDNHKSRKLVSDRACELRNVVVISGGNDLVDGDILVHIRRDGVDLTPPMTQYHREIEFPTDLHPNEARQAGCDVLAQSKAQIVITNNIVAALMLAAFHNVTDPEVYSRRVLRNLPFHGEVCIDLPMLKAVPRERIPVAKAV